ncbi:dnaJ homolog subfamily A member 3, mitochondrial-like [Limanda limanda]|uniref:dnaJ homolog subfamily A member 3, mitochondrial-like n=1 Tax=Limanda limanda TaxID=27771 RepID=UPI0029C92319|nr:dnaJ homolog subfamily A member 3, mitochondrial-like [Limanda limanda]
MCHPDDSGAKEEFAKLAEAYEVLSDEVKRKQYDTYGAAGRTGQQQYLLAARTNIDPEELIRTIFAEFSGGKGFGNINIIIDQGLEFVMELTFIEAAKGADKELTLNIQDSCPRCNGMGREPGTMVSPCPYCNGTEVELNSTGPFLMYSTCLRCGGKGSIIITPCALCRGSGQMKKRQTVTVPVPAGVEDGQTVSMPVRKTDILITFRKSDLSKCQSNLTKRRRAVRFPHVSSCWSLHTSSRLGNKQDLYQVLGVSRTATKKEIKKSYYQLAKKCHPDANPDDPGAEAKFVKLAEAYEVLSDEVKRRQYDHGQASAGSTGVHLEELFRTILRWFIGGMGFGDSMFDQRPDFVMELTFIEAAKGADKELTLNIQDSCPRCNGMGREPGTMVLPCPYCNGTGVELNSTGPFLMYSTCLRCGGKGSIIITPCALCRGSGQMKKRQTVTVPVPAGVEDGQTVSMPVGKTDILITFRE